jgi:hypothetical protein
MSPNQKTREQWATTAPLRQHQHPRQDRNTKSHRVTNEKEGTMQALMIGHLTGKDYVELWPEEGMFIAKARAEGLVRDVFLKADHTGPILILADTTADEARERMASLPFIVHDIASFDYIELDLPPASSPVGR